MIIAFFGGIIYNDRHQLFSGMFDLIWGGIIFFGGFYSLFQSAKAWCVYAVQIVVTDREILVYNGRSAEESIPYNNICSYRYEENKGAYALQIKLWTGGNKSFNAGGQLLTTGETAVFIDMVRAFESAVSNYQPEQQHQTASVRIFREKTFFEKPIATVFLVICSLLIAASIVLMVVKHKFVTGSFISSLGLFIPFAAGWYNARKTKREG